MWKKLFAPGLILIVVPTIVGAQDASYFTDSVRWSLAEAIAWSKQHNIQVNITRLDKSLNEQDVLQARAARYPDLFGSASQSFTHRNSTNNGQSNLAGNYSLNSSWTVYRGGYLNNDIKSKDLQLRAANLNVAVTENDITLQVTQAFLNVLLAKENISYIQQLVKTSQAQYSQGQTLYDAGSISKKALLQLQGQAAGDQYNLVSAETQYRQNVITLKQILQLPTTTDLQPSAPDSIAAIQAIPSLLQAQSLAAQNRPEIKYNELQIQVAETELQKARAGFKPTISVGGNISTGYADNQGVKYFNQVNNNLYQNLGVTLSVPILDNRLNKTNVERSKILVEQARLTMEQTRTTLNQQVEQAYTAVQNAQAQYRAAEVELAANREVYNISQEELKLGSINIVDLLVQRNAYILSLQNFIQAKYNAILNTKIYEFYVGQPISL